MARKQGQTDKQTHGVREVQSDPLVKNTAGPGLEMNAPAIWNQIVENTHAPLFDTQFLLSMGEVYAREFQGQPFDNATTIPAIPATACRFSQAGEITATRSGFDLPSLVTPQTGWNGKFVAFAAQDPLRKAALEPKLKDDFWPNCLTMSNPWGFSFANNRGKRHGAKLWHCIEWLCSVGYGVYITDVHKLYVEQKGFLKSEDTAQRERKVFEAEVSAVKPEIWVAFGDTAQRALQEFNVKNVDLHPHPNARHPKLREHYGTENQTFGVIKEAMQHQISQALNLKN